MEPQPIACSPAHVVRIAFVLGASVVACMCGCRQEKAIPDRTPTYPVHGTLLINGAAAPGAMVKFYADTSGGRIPTAVVREDGSFSASFYDNEDGAPAGEYKLLVVWMLPPPEGGLAQDVLGGQFLDPARAVSTITVHPAENRLPPIDLNAPVKVNPKIPK